MEPGWVTARQIEAARRAIVRAMRRRGKFWIRIFPDKPVTRKPAETRMGKGKGGVEFWVAVVRPGRIMFEIGGGLPDEMMREALHLAQYKLAIRTKIVGRHDQVGGGE
jgi:large subunit ribosomal protein L16